MTQHQQICTALRAWINQRPGLEFANYGEINAYRQELRSIARDRADALTMLAVVENPRAPEATLEQWQEAFRAFSGRLTLTPRHNGVALDYCTGQYWPTEYRAAAAAVLASRLWAQAREALPAPTAYAVDGYSEWQGDRFVTPRLGVYLTQAAAEQHPDVDTRTAIVHPLYGAKQLRAGDYLRHGFVRQFGRRIANKWFN